MSWNTFGNSSVQFITPYESFVCCVFTSKTQNVVCVRLADVVLCCRCGFMRLSLVWGCPPRGGSGGKHVIGYRVCLCTKESLSSWFPIMWSIQACRSPRNGYLAVSCGPVKLTTETQQWNECNSCCIREPSPSYLSGEFMEQFGRKKQECVTNQQKWYQNGAALCSRPWKSHLRFFDTCLK